MFTGYKTATKIMECHQLKKENIQIKITCPKKVNADVTHWRIDRRAPNV